MFYWKLEETKEMATKKSTAEQVKVAMEKVEAAKAAETKTVKEEKAPTTKTAAKKTTATKTTAKKTTTAKTTTAKKAPAKKAVKTTQTVYVQCCGYEVTTEEVVAKVTEIVGKKVKELNIYVKPEDGMIYYTADGEQGSLAL